jgi:outer membrane protein OmpA-like peptidoglycan-associated protein
MKYWILFILPIFSIFAESQVLEGQVIQSGAFLRTKDKTIEILSSILTPEIAQLNGETVRIQCEWKKTSCHPLRYEIAPFLEETNVPQWSLKKIPKYITKQNFVFNPQPSADGETLFFTAVVKEGNRSNQKIWSSQWEKDGFWSPGVQLDKPLNNKLPSAVISSLPGGNELFLFGSFGEDEAIQEVQREFRDREVDLNIHSSNRKDWEWKMAELHGEYRRKVDKIMNRAPLYKTVRNKTSWNDPVPIQFPEYYNLYRKKDSPNQQIFGGSTLSAGGKALIFSAQQKECYGKLDLYVSLQDEHGVFSKAINLGEAVNSPEEEMAPFLAPDDRTLYFSSSGHDGLSIYVTKRKGDSWTEWSKPQELSKNLRGANFLSIPAKGNWAYISRDGELFMAYMPKEFTPDPTVLVKGRVIHENGTPLPAKVNYESLLKKGDRGSAVSNPNSGEFSLVIPMGEKMGFYVQEEGFLPVSYNLDLSDASKEHKEVNVDIVLTPVKVGSSIVLNNLFFQTNSSEILSDSSAELDRLAKLMKSNPRVKVLIEGHTDSQGNKEKNDSLSQKRAEAVAKYLSEIEKIDPNRIQTIGFGFSKPIASNDTDEGKKKNRRVVFKILEG